MKKKRVYVESSVISWLTARPSNDVIKIAKQRLTHLWWAHRDKWDLYISPTVLREIEKGNPDAARKRIQVVEGLPRLPESAEAARLAEYLIASGALPEKAFTDALHIAIATVSGMDFLLTWNQKHLFNMLAVDKLCRLVRAAGYSPAIPGNPEMFLMAASVETTDGA